jgi:hypothetical protein
MFDVGMRHKMLVKELVEVRMFADPDPRHGVAMPLRDRADIQIDSRRPQIRVTGEFLKRK